MMSRRPARAPSTADRSIPARSNRGIASSRMRPRGRAMVSGRASLLRFMLGVPQAIRDSRRVFDPRELESATYVKLPDPMTRALSSIALALLLVGAATAPATAAEDPEALIRQGNE